MDINNFDGKQFLEILFASALEKGDPKMAKIFEVFRKHNIGAMDTMIILLELSMVLSTSDTENQENKDGV